MIENIPWLYEYSEVNVETIFGLIRKVNEIIDHLNKKESPGPGWISVKDRLPNPGEFVLIYTAHDPDCSEFTQFEVASHNKYGWVAQGDYNPIPEVTHWMPLPEPPEENNVRR